MNVLFVCRQNAGRSQIAQALYAQKGHTAGVGRVEELHAELVATLGA